MQIEGKCCVVTGAGSGIGAATAAALGEQRGRVVLVDIRQAEADERAAELRARGFDARSYAADVRSFEAMEEFGAWVEREIGGVDVLVNAAGVLRTGGFSATSLEDFQEVFAVNYWGVVHATKVVLPGMLARGAGGIVHVASASGIVGFAPLSAYSSSKFAVVGLGAALRAEVRSHGVQVSTICPGLVRTDIVKNAPLPPEESARLQRTLNDKGVDASLVAREIVSALRYDRPEVYVGADAKALALLDRLVPAHASTLLQRWTRRS